MRLRLGFDVDGVLADFAYTYLNIAHSLFGHSLDPAANPVWNFNIPKNQANVLWKQIRTTRNFWTSLPTINEPRLPQHKHTLIFITSRVPTDGNTPEAQTGEWLYSRLGIEYPTVLVVNHWHEKSALYRDLRLHAFIDDKVETVQQFRKHNQNCYVFAQPWNQEVTEKRVSAIEDFVRSVENEFPD